MRIGVETLLEALRPYSFIIFNFISLMSRYSPSSRKSED